MPSARPLAPMPRGEAVERRTQATLWMLKAAESQEAVGREWRQRGVALMAAGIVWDVVRTPYSALGRGFDRCIDPRELRSQVQEMGVGAVWCDPFRPFLYFMVPPGTDRHWPSDMSQAGLDCLGGTPPYTRHTGVPRLDRLSPPGHYWLVPPDYGGDVLADPVHLHKELRERAGELSAQTPNTP
ncbi:hypothetical protein [Streptomyces sp. CAS3]